MLYPWLKRILCLLLVFPLLGFSPPGPYQYVNPYQNPCEDDTGLCATRWGCCGTGVWVWPTDSRELDVREFGASHPAIDILVNNGDPVYAVDNGIVNWAGFNSWGYGNLVIINHGGSRQTYYAHLGDISVTCGQYVTRGQVVGTIDNRLGRQGASVNPHLHFEYRRGRYNYSPWLKLNKPPSQQSAPPPVLPSPGISVVIGGDR